LTESILLLWLTESTSVLRLLLLLRLTESILLLWLTESTSVRGGTKRWQWCVFKLLP